jgi:two-component system, OmpR family, phosphate regulon response regulator PhoB
VQGIALEYPSFDGLLAALGHGAEEHELGLPDLHGLNDGQWVVVSFTIGDESTSVAGRVQDRGNGLCLTFAERDWSRLSSFAAGEGPPSCPPSCRGSGPELICAPPGTRVLVVDDDSATQTIVCQLLRSSGICPDSAGSAEEALAVLESSPADLVVLDWSLPGMSGVELCQRLREDQRLAGLPVLFLTAHSTSDDLVRAFDAGADDFVCKPFRAPELRARVLGLLRRSRSPEVLAS